MVDMAEKLKMPELLEAEWTVKSNSMFHLIGESIRKEIGFPDPNRIWIEWNAWIKNELKKLGK